jgi:anti-sigma factor RsiW
MTNTVKEQLSAFLDGELPEAETTLLLKRLERDDELKGTLSRYSLIGAALRAEGAVVDASNVASRVRAALVTEPALGARRLSRWLRPVAGLATAAGVAAATVALLPFLFGGDEAPTVVVAQTPVAVPAAATSLADEAVVPVVAVVDESPPAYTIPPPVEAATSPLSSAQLASYLVAHSEYVSPLARRSVLSAVTVEKPDVESPPAPATPEGDAPR